MYVGNWQTIFLKSWVSFVGPVVDILTWKGVIWRCQEARSRQTTHVAVCWVYSLQKLLVKACLNRTLPGITNWLLSLGMTGLQEDFTTLSLSCFTPAPRMSGWWGANPLFAPPRSISLHTAHVFAGLAPPGQIHSTEYKDTLMCILKAQTYRKQKTTVAIFLKHQINLNSEKRKLLLHLC